MYQVTLYDNLPPNILNIPYLRIIGRRTFNGVLWANEVITPGDGLSTRTLKLYKVIHRWPLNTVYTQSHTLSHDGTSFASVPTLIDRSDVKGHDPLGPKHSWNFFLLQYLWHLDALQEQGFLCHEMCVRVKAALPEIFLRLPNRFHALLNWMITISSYGLIRSISFIVVGEG